MAEESIDLLVTPEKNELDSRNMSKYFSGNSDSLSNGRSNHARNRRASIGSYHAGDSSLRNFTKKSDSANSSQNVVPHYLRASTGSCHDFCKYGREHSFEKKARKRLRKIIAKPLPVDQYSMQIQVSGGQKEEKVVNHGLPADTKDHSPDLKPSPVTKSYSPKPKPSLHTDKATRHKLSKDTKSHSTDMPPSDAKSYSRKLKMPSDVETYSPKENSSSGNNTLLSKCKPSSIKKFPSPDPPEIVKNVIFPSTEVEDSVKHLPPIADKMSTAENKTSYVAQQRFSPVMSKPFKVKPLSSSDNSDGILGEGRRNSSSKTGNILTAFPKPAKKLLAAPAAAAAASPKLFMNKTAHVHSGKAGNSKLVSPLKNRNRLPRIKSKESNNEKVSEKTMHVVKAETEDNVSESIPGDHAILSLPSPASAESLYCAKHSSLTSHEEDTAETEHSGSEADKVISDNNGSQDIDNMPPVKDNKNKTLKTSRLVVSEDKYRPPVKVKFRSGKVVDLQSDNNSPRRLRFRRARFLGADDNKGDLRRRTLKKAEVNNDITDAEVPSDKVVLKDTDVQGKKDAQGLFNNVIEATASKLVESRKSKVKALVGAFETVISLQESKPSLQVFC